MPLPDIHVWVATHLDDRFIGVFDTVQTAEHSVAAMFHASSWFLFWRENNPAAPRAKAILEMMCDGELERVYIQEVVPQSSEGY